MSKRILLISRFYLKEHPAPPVQRIRGLEKFLTEAGFHVRVLYDRSIPDNASRKSAGIIRWIGWPDSHISFPARNMRNLKEILESFDPHFVYITAPPFSTLLFLPFISGRKVLVEFRDVWSFDEILRLYRTPLQKALARIYEGYSIKRAWKVICINENQCRYLMETHGVPPDKFITLPHFFVPMDKSRIERRPGNHLKICYTGTVDWMKGLVKVIPIMKKFHLIDIIIRGNIRNVKIEGVKILPPIPHEDALKWAMDECDILWVSLDRFRGHHLITSSKSKSLLATGKPLLATIPSDNPMYRDFEKIGGIYMADIDDRSELESVLNKLIEDWKRGELKKPENPEIFRYDNVLKKLKEILE